jgi:hypothetical protein
VSLVLSITITIRNDINVANFRGKQKFQICCDTGLLPDLLTSAVSFLKFLIICGNASAEHNIAHAQSSTSAATGCKKMSMQIKPVVPVKYAKNDSHFLIRFALLFIK